ncbi:hypothetical protein EVJ58_g7892 [Rhodofomes roseus]|uniref:Uncharacterized protein n=1 Tax=Rhodofomes roseus TaxID=34475 RepID=A0A4Y9Y267_9APHY|nr:hypothetical protein EVJ58_g7892 [Rhodofomes roseus]
MPIPKINPASWSIVSYGEHGPAIPDHPLPNAAVFVLRLRSGKQRGWTATSCFVWTRDAGLWIDRSKLGKKKRRGVLDSDFDMSPEEVAGLRELHKAIGSSSTPRPTRAPSPRRPHAPQHPSPNIVVDQSSPSAMEADADDFSRRLKITAASSPRPSARAQAGPSSGSPGKLYNPNSDSPRRVILTAEPEAMSDAASSSQEQPPDSHRQLFDHRKDDPVRFLARPQASPNAAANRPHVDRPTPTPKSSGDYVSASSTSSASYAHSTLSSNFTLSSATTDSSAPSGLFENPNARRSEVSSSSTNAFSMQLKKLYRGITALEQKILGEQRDKDADDEGNRNTQTVGILIKGRPGSVGGLAGGAEVRGGEDDMEKWKRLLVDHKELAEKVQNLLTLTLAPTVPASLRNIPTKYNLIARLWAHAFHRLLESLRQAASPPNNSHVALEYLQDFIYYAYTFYCALLEERNLSDFRSGWVEALGDLSRYQMAYCALVEKQQTVTATTLLSAPAPSPMTLLTKSMAPGADSQIDTQRPSTPNGGGSSNRAELRAPAAPEVHARINDSPPPSPGRAARLVLEVPSVGLAAARAMELVPEKEHWRQIVREWYTKGLRVAGSVIIVSRRTRAEM